MFKRFVEDETGATAIEYGLIAAMLGVAMIASFVTLRAEYDSMYAFIEDGVRNANNP
jgi:pilus assembly protein Flp/PilA